MSASPHKFLAGIIPLLLLARLAAGQVQPAPSASAQTGAGAEPAGAPAGTPPDAAAPITATVLGDRVNIRAGTDTRYEVLGQLKRGDIVKAKAVQGRWLGIEPPAVVGVWIHQDFVREDEVIGDRVNLRAGPGTNFTRVGQVVRGEKLTILESVDGWLRIEPPASVVVWAHLDFLELAPGLLERLSPASSGQEGAADTPAATPPSSAGQAAPMADEVGPAPADPAAIAAGAGQPAQERAEPDLSERLVVGPDETRVDQEAPISDAKLFPEVPEETPPSTDFIVHQVRTDDQTPAAPAATDAGAGARSRLRWPTEEEFRRLGKAVSREGVLQKLVTQENETLYAIVNTVGVRSAPECFLFSPAADLGQYEGQKVRVQGRELWAARTRPVVRVERISAAW